MDFNYSIILSSGIISVFQNLEIQDLSLTLSRLLYGRTHALHNLQLDPLSYPNQRLSLHTANTM